MECRDAARHVGRDSQTSPQAAGLAIPVGIGLASAELPRKVGLPNRSHVAGQTHEVAGATGANQRERRCNRETFKRQPSYSGDPITGPVIKGISDGPEIIHVAGYLCPFREVFPDQAVGVLVGAALPRGMGVGEIHRKVRGER